MKKLIIFDYDGVIVDSFPATHNIYKKMCSELGKDCPESLKEFKEVYGHSSAECYSQLKFNDEEILKGNKIFRREIKNIIPELFTGIREVLEKLSKDYTLILVSSSYRENIEHKLQHFNLSKYFQEVFGRESIGVKHFKKTESIKAAIDRYGTPENTISIGDRNVDFIDGSKAGLKNIILVDYGWGYDLSLIPEYKQKIKIKSPIELIEAINQF